MMRNISVQIAEEWRIKQRTSVLQQILNETKNHPSFFYQVTKLLDNVYVTS